MKTIEKTLKCKNANMLRAAFYALVLDKSVDQVLRKLDQR